MLRNVPARGADGDRDVDEVSSMVTQPTVFKRWRLSSKTYSAFSIRYVIAYVLMGASELIE
jgi:hypothetical protein